MLSRAILAHENAAEDIMCRIRETRDKTAHLKAKEKVAQAKSSFEQSETLASGLHHLVPNIAGYCDMLKVPGEIRPQWSVSG